MLCACLRRPHPVPAQTPIWPLQADLVSLNRPDGRSRKEADSGFSPIMVLLILASASLLLQSTFAIPLTDKHGKVTIYIHPTKIMTLENFHRCGSATTLSTKSWHLLSGRRSVQATITLQINLLSFFDNLLIRHRSSNSTISLRQKDWTCSQE